MEIKQKEVVERKEMTVYIANDGRALTNSIGICVNILSEILCPKCYAKENKEVL